MAWFRDNPLFRWLFAVMLAFSLSTTACVFDTDDDGDVEEVDVDDGEDEEDMDVETEVEVEETP